MQMSTRSSKVTHFTFALAGGFLLLHCGADGSSTGAGADGGASFAGAEQTAGGAAAHGGASANGAGGAVAAQGGQASAGGNRATAGASNSNAGTTSTGAGGGSGGNGPHTGGTSAGGASSSSGGSSGSGTAHTGGTSAGGASSGGTSAGGSGAAGSGTGGSTGGTWNTTGITCTPQNWDAAPIGWATQSGSTTGGGNASATVVTSSTEFNAAAKGTNTAVIHVSGKLSGTFTVGSNKTILGLCGAQLTGSLDLTGSSNVIVRNLTVVGNNCKDNPSDCSGGADAVHVEQGDKHLWFDHMDISDGSDGNLDITHAADFITISWTKFHYSSKRTDPVAGASGHRFCNLIGHSDSNGSEDTGHLNVTFHHVWWADNVNQRMPRVRFGKVHVFNSLYTATGDSACIEVGVSSNIRSENNVFQGVSNTVDTSHSNSASIIQSIGNQGSSTNLGGNAFTPPYSYQADAVSSVAANVMSGAGPK